MGNFLDDYGTWLVLASLCFLAYAMVLPMLASDKMRRKRRERWQASEQVVRFSCFSCKESGVDRRDPEFDCSWCEGTGIISYSVHIGGSIWHDYSSRLDFRAKMTESRRNRFIGFQEPRPAFFSWGRVDG